MKKISLFVFILFGCATANEHAKTTASNTKFEANCNSVGRTEAQCRDFYEDCVWSVNKCIWRGPADCIEKNLIQCKESPAKCVIIEEICTNNIDYYIDEK